MRTLAALSVLGSLVLAMASSPACSSGSSGSSGSAADAGAGDTTSAIEAGASLPIGVQGGAVTSADGIVILEIPPGALATTTTLTASPIASPDEGDAGVVGQVYDLEPSGTTFAAPITIAFELTPAMIDAGNAGNFTIATYANGVWSAVDSVLVANTAITAQISHFSPWALVEKSAATSTTIGTTRCADGVVCASPTGTTCSYEDDAGEPVFCICNGQTYECFSDGGADASADASR